jgi:arylsulfatase
VKSLARLAFAAVMASSGPAWGTPKHLVLVTVDTLRADRLGSYGNALGLTPRLDELARESLVFESAYAPASLTFLSVASILTGRHPEELGLWNNESRFPEAVPTLAGELRRSGFRTCAVVSNFVLRTASGLARGFDEYDDRYTEIEAVRKVPERGAAATTDAMLALLDGCLPRGGRGFVWIHYQDPHGPYTPPAGLRERFLPAEQGAPDGARRLPLLQGHQGIGGVPRYQVVDDRRDVAFYRAGYDGETAYVDSEIGRALDALRKRGSLDEALVVLTADHGEALGEDDYWFAHGEHVTEPLTRVPLLIRSAGLPAGRREEVVGLVDVAPTVLRLLTGEALPSSGRDLLSAPTPDRTLYLANLGGGKTQRHAIVFGEFRYLESPTRPEGHLSRRRGGGEDLSGALPQVAQEARRRLAEVRAGLARAPGERQPLSPEDVEKLRALGYTE